MGIRLYVSAPMTASPFSPAGPPRAEWNVYRVGHTAGYTVWWRRVAHSATWHITNDHNHLRHHMSL